MESRYHQLIQCLALTGHPEGGYYREVYRAGDILPAGSLPDRFMADRNAGTAIYYLLRHPEVSRFHRILSDELWHHYEGSRILLHMIDTGGSYSTAILGKDLPRGERSLVVVPHGCWFAAEVPEEGGYALAGCTVAPGFDFHDFELADGRALSEAYPTLGDIIRRFT
ncbi:MAG: cupin domain-containing protein [Spirochaetes bacterium]|nr:cupin domain-containing protein [Spirochaetota bacterium]